MSRLESLVRALLYNYFDHYDIVLGIESDKRDWRGTLGHGKTDTALRIVYWLKYELNRIAALLGFDDLEFDFDMARDLVVKDNLEQFREVLSARGFGRFKVYDEAEWFFSKRYHQFRDVRALDAKFDSNRKEGSVHVLVLPNVFDAIDKIAKERLQVLFRKQGRESMVVCVRNGISDPQRNVWGRTIVRVQDMRPVPAYLWKEYEQLYDRHDAICPEEDVCVSAIRDRWGRSREDGDA